MLYFCNMNPTDKLKTLLKKQGYNITKPRVATFEALLEAHEALTIAQIIERLPGIDMVSVYRTLQLFEKAEIVHRVWNGFKSKIELSETFSPHHHHFTCNNCGIAQAIESDELEQSLHALEDQYGFDLRQHSVELSGYCKRCQSIRDSSKIA
jgi:Fur family transcriptional regulator, ferric uptake regulator